MIRAGTGVDFDGGQIFGKGDITMAGGKCACGALLTDEQNKIIKRLQECSAHVFPEGRCEKCSPTISKEKAKPKFVKRNVGFRYSDKFGFPT
jgi:hypothetical protein